MKTVWKFETYLKLFVILFALSFAGCKDNEDPDPRQAFIGAYEMDDFDITVVSASVGVDTTFSLPHESEIEFETDDELDTDELKVELEDFLENVILEGLSVFASPGTTVAVSVDIDDTAIAEISGNEFELDDLSFTITVTSGGTPSVFNCEIKGQGELESDELTHEFEITILGDAGNVIFEGTITGERN